MNSYNGIKTVTQKRLVLRVEEVLVKYELRRWRGDEIPVGSFFQDWTGKGRIQQIIGYDPMHASIARPAILLSNAKYPGHDDHFFIGDLVTSTSEPKYSWDGINWNRCGTWIEVE